MLRWATLVSLVACAGGGAEQEGYSESACALLTQQAIALHDAGEWAPPVPAATKQLVSGADLYAGAITPLGDLTEVDWLHTIGDLDGDGLEDVAAELEGRVHVASAADLARGAEVDRFTALPEVDFAHFGHVVAFDIDGDGHSEAVVADGTGAAIVDGAELVAGLATVTPDSPRLELPREGLYGFRTVDYDGDGLDDLHAYTAWLTEDGIPAVTLVAFLAADLHAGSRAPSPMSAAVRRGDVDGDGRPEFELPIASGDTAYHLYDGRALDGALVDGPTTPLVTWSPPHGSLAFADIDLDTPGDDVVLTKLFETPSRWGISGCSRVAGLPLAALPAEVSDADSAHAPWQPYAGIGTRLIGDVDGDGLADALLYATPIGGTSHDVGGLTGADLLDGHTALDPTRGVDADAGLRIDAVLGDVDGDSVRDVVVSYR